MKLKKNIKRDLAKDPSQLSDDVTFEMATVLDEISRVKCVGLKHAYKKEPVACSYFLNSESHHNSPRAFWKQDRTVPYDISQIHKMAGLSYIFNREYYEKRKMLEMESPKVELKHEEGHYIDMENAERFGGIMPHLYKKECNSGMLSVEGKQLRYRHGKKVCIVERGDEADDDDDHIFALPGPRAYGTGPKPPVHIHKIIEIARENFSAAEVLKLHAIAENLNSLPCEHTFMDFLSSGEDISKEIEEIVEEEERKIPPVKKLEEETHIHDDQKDFRWLSVCEELSKVQEPEHPIYGWMVSPETYSTYMDRGIVKIPSTHMKKYKEEEYELEDIDETARFFVDNIIAESEIIVDSWEKAIGIVKEKRTKALQEKANRIAEEKANRIAMPWSVPVEDVPEEAEEVHESEIDERRKINITILAHIAVEECLLAAQFIINTKEEEKRQEEKYRRKVAERRAMRRQMREKRREERLHQKRVKFEEEEEEVFHHILSWNPTSRIYDKKEKKYVEKMYVTPVELYCGPCQSELGFEKAREVAEVKEEMVPLSRSYDGKFTPKMLKPYQVKGKVKAGKKKK